VAKYYYEDLHSAFSLVEESSCFRIKMERPEIEEQHVEEFLDKTVEWLSSNPDKSMLIDFNGVKRVCSDFMAQVTKYYEDTRAKGFVVSLVNVDPTIKPYLNGTASQAGHTPSERPVLSVSTKQALDDIRNQLSDEEMREKHGLSKRGLRSLFKKLVAKGVVKREDLDKRNRRVDLVFEDEQSESKSVRISAADVLKDVAEGMTNEALMRKYKLSPKGLQSALKKLYAKGLVSRDTFLKGQENKP
jgi:DNA-binding HxlR family transcriptional regulator/anti-anti-sigma regulatory factor